MPLSEQLRRLAAFPPTPLPVISLYLDARADQHGRDNFGAFVRKELGERGATFHPRTPAGESFVEDTARIEAFLATQLRPSANGVAIFACAGEGGFFEALQLDVPIDQNRLYVYHQPHLYPLARLSDRYRRYAAVIADTNAARIYVFGIGAALLEEVVRNPKTSRTAVGGLNQARYQRHNEEYHRSHVREVVDVLDWVVREEAIEQIVVAGDEVVIPILKAQLPPRLAEKVVDVLRLDILTPEHEVLRATLDAFHEHDAKTDAEKVERLLDAYRAGGLGVIGAHDTLLALNNGQVDELLLSAALEEAHPEAEEMGAILAPEAPRDGETESGARAQVKVAGELVTGALRTGATVTVVEDPNLLADVGGVGALLRYRLPW